MAAVTICSDFVAQKDKVSHCFPNYLLWSDGTRCHDLSCLNAEFSANFFTLLHNCVHCGLFFSLTSLHEECKLRPGAAKKRKEKNACNFCPWLYRQKIQIIFFKKLICGYFRKADMQYVIMLLVNKKRCH